MDRKPIDDPPNPFSSTDRVYLEGLDPGVPPTIYLDHTRQILAENDSPDLGFRYSVNPYRGCMHACAYCYARPTHEYLSFGAGTDFDRRILVKQDAPALLREAFERRAWRGEVVVFSGVTDCYQPLEASYRLTRACLEVCLEYKNPVGIITKAPLVERDLDLLQRLRDEARVFVSISVPFFDEDNARKIEPGVATPSRRLRTIEALRKAGIPVGVMVAPVIPGLNDEDIPAILEAAAAAGAETAGYVLLRLPKSAETVFVDRLQRAMPLRADKILHRIGATRPRARSVDGDQQLYDARFFVRQRGEGEYADMIGRLFRKSAERHGLVDKRGHDGSMWRSDTTTFQRPRRPSTGQLSFFDE